jgi:hypothetical protein
MSGNRDYSGGSAPVFHWIPFSAQAEQAEAKSPYGRLNKYVQNYNLSSLLFVKDDYSSSMKKGEKRVYVRFKCKLPQGIVWPAP